MRWKAFYFPVRLRAPGPGESAADVEVVAGLSPGVLAVGPGVVGEHSLDGYAVPGEPGMCPAEEGRAGSGLLVGQGFGVGQPGVIVERGVQEQVSAPTIALLVGASGRAPEDAVSAAVGDATQLLHIDVDEFARAGAFVATHHFAGGTVAGGQSRAVVTAQDLVHGRGGDRDSSGDAQRPDLVLVAQPQDLGFNTGTRALGVVARPTGAVEHGLLAAMAVPPSPTDGGGVRDLEPLRSPA